MLSVDAACNFLAVGLRQYVHAMLALDGYKGEKAASNSYLNICHVPSAVTGDVPALNRLFDSFAQSAVYVIRQEALIPESLAFAVEGIQTLDNVTLTVKLTPMEVPATAPYPVIGH